MKISVIIPSYNQPNTIQSCVSSLLLQKFTGDFEIIIVDSSNSDIQEQLEEYCKIDNKIRLVKLSNQTYPGSARNIGIKESNADIVALIDSDCIADENWLEGIFSNMNDNTILTGIISNGTENSIFGTSSFLVEFNLFLDSNQEKVETYAAATCNFACKRDVFESFGLFSDDRAFEDFIFCKRFTNAKGQILKYRDIKISHVNKTDLIQILDNQKMLGEYSARVRRENNLPPKLIFNLPILSFALIGFRYMSILSRVWKTNHLLKFILYTPIILYILAAWSKGFFIGARIKLQQSTLSSI